MGAQKTDPKQPNYDQGPVHEVTLAEFKISKNPVTAEEYLRFVAHDGYQQVEHWQTGGFGQFTEPARCSNQVEYLNRLMVEVSWFEAAAYCAWSNSRLPSEVEWERAARGTTARRSPRGNEPADATRLNDKMNVGHPTPVGIYPTGHTPEGLADMAATVWERCDSWWDK